MKSHFSRRGFLKLLGAFGGFLAAEVVGLVPELQTVASGDGRIQPERLLESQHHRLRGAANRNDAFKQLQDYLVERGFELQEALVDAVRFQTDELEAEMLMLGFNGSGQGATLIFVAGNAEGKVLDNSFAWVVDEAVYISKDEEVTQLPEATERMKGVPRLPEGPPSEGNSGTLLAKSIHAAHCPCHNEYSACYVWNALCASLTAGCFLNPLICPAAAVACANAIANCFVATQCGPPC